MSCFRVSSSRLPLQVQKADNKEWVLHPVMDCGSNQDQNCCPALSRNFTSHVLKHWPPNGPTPKPDIARWRASMRADGMLVGSNVQLPPPTRDNLRNAPPDPEQRRSLLPDKEHQRPDESGKSSQASSVSSGRASSGGAAMWGALQGVGAIHGPEASRSPYLSPGDYESRDERGMLPRWLLDRQRQSVRRGELAERSHREGERSVWPPGNDDGDLIGGH